jgi:hypothetical protein
MKIQWSAGPAQWARWIAFSVAGDIFGFEQPIAMQAEDIVSQTPFLSGRNLVQPFCPGRRRHLSQFDLSHG